MKYPRSPHEKVGGIVHFGRMLDKIRLKAAGELHPDLHENVGRGFDKRCTDFLHVSHAELAQGLENRPDIQTMFDYIDADEGRLS